MYNIDELKWDNIDKSSLMLQKCNHLTVPGKSIGTSYIGNNLIQNIKLFNMITIFIMIFKNKRPK